MGPRGGIRYIYIARPQRMVQMHYCGLVIQCSYENIMGARLYAASSGQ